MADAGYQLITSIIFVIVKRDFDYSEGFGSYGLGLVSDVAVEFGLSEGLFIGGSESEFLNLACLIINNGGNPRILTAFVAYFDCTGNFAVDLLESGNRFQLQLLLAVDMVCHYISYAICMVDVLQKRSLPICERGAVAFCYL
ncbi:hypothetical protein [Nostoc sp. NMS8]|uniref:hypothetical protein n=1 Tax=Nostoc sp. NMS8 TaxID=2815392 RepID=UPI0025CD2109|nr:hypothetical protein [Nostoc sp. NMS8]